MKRIHRLRLIPLALVALVAALPAAMSHASPVASAGPARPDTASAALRMTYFGVGNKTLIDQQILPQFRKAYPNVAVTVEPEPDSRVKGVLEIAAGTSPDVFMLGDGDAVWYSYKGALADLVPFANRDHFALSQYIPGTLVIGHVGSHQYALTKDYSPIAVFYNKDMFKAAGLPFPSSHWTWDEFRQDAIKLTKNGVYGATMSGDWVRLVDPVVRSLGGQLDSPDGRRVLGYMNSPATVKAVQFWVNLFMKDKIAPTPSQAAALNIGDPFASQKAAMSVTGVWNALGTSGYPHTLKFHWGVAPFPSGTGHTHVNTICWAGFVMSKSTRHPQEAWELLKYMSGPVGDSAWASAGLPAIKSVADRLHVWTNPVFGVFLHEVAFTDLPADINGPAAAAAVGDNLTAGLDLLLNPSTAGVSVAQVLTIEAKKGQKEVDSYYSSK